MRRRAFLRQAGLVGGAVVAGGLGVKAADSAYGADQAAVMASTISPQAVHGQLRISWSAQRTDKVAALTFDDGPTPQFTARVLDILAAHHVPATFFVIGRLVELHPGLVLRARDAGHEIGNHSFDHVSAAKATAAHVLGSVRRGADTIERVTGRRPRWYRPPRGEVTTAALLAARAVGQEVALWSVVRNGPDGGGPDADATGVRRHLVAAIHPGAIIDLHDGIGRSDWTGIPNHSLLTRRSTEIGVLDEVVTAWLQAGYRFTTLSDLIPTTTTGL